jgi:hypothetical protein
VTIPSDEGSAAARRDVEAEAGGAVNRQVAERLREAAALLAQQQANPFRVSAYRRAAETMAGLNEDVAVFLERDGIEGLDALPGIGPVLARAIAQMVRTGRWAQLERLRRGRARAGEILKGAEDSKGGAALLRGRVRGRLKVLQARCRRSATSHYEGVAIGSFSDRVARRSRSTTSSSLSCWKSW